MAQTAPTASRTPPAPPPAVAPGAAAPAPPADPAAASRASEFRPLANSRIKLLHSSEADYGNIWGATLPTGTPLSDVTKPEFWSNHAHRVRPFDRIWLDWDDGHAEAVGKVRQVAGAGTNMSRAVVAITQFTEFGPIPRQPGVGATHVVEYCGPHRKHAVVRVADGCIVSDGHETPQAASQHLQNIVRQQPKG